MLFLNKGPLSGIIVFIFLVVFKSLCIKDTEFFIYVIVWKLFGEHVNSVAERADVEDPHFTSVFFRCWVGKI